MKMRRSVCSVLAVCCLIAVFVMGILRPVIVAKVLVWTLFFGVIVNGICVLRDLIVFFMMRKAESNYRKL